MTRCQTLRVTRPMSSRFQAITDTVLDRTIVPGFSRIGYAVRRRWWEPIPDGALEGKTIAVTGANSGIGEAVVGGAAKLGARVLMLCRNAERGEAARQRVRSSHPGADLLVVTCDVSEPESVRAAAAQVAREAPQLHGLAHNAGAMLAQRQENSLGHELTYQTHILGPHLLTALLAPALQEDGDSRVVFMSSGGMYTQRLPLDDLEFEKSDYNGTVAYARTKRMQVALAEEWAHTLPADRVTVSSMHPGWVDTPGVKSSLPGFGVVAKPILRPVDEGADTMVWLLATDRSSTPTGMFWQDRRARPTAYLSARSHSSADAHALWRACVAATGVPA